MSEETPEQTGESESFLVSWQTPEGTEEEGPLYVLWQLIESYKVDIFNVSLSKITEAFVEFITRATELRIELASSFAVMASRLVYYKSKALLPDPGFEETDSDDRLPPELIEQLLEYRRFQMASDKLRLLEESASLMSPRPETDLGPGEEVWVQANVVDLIAAYTEVIRRFQKLQKPDHHVELDAQQYSVEDKIQEIETLLTDAVSCDFQDLFSNLEQMDLGEIIAVFLAILELARQRTIIIQQNKQFGDIRIVKRSVTVH